MVRLNLRESRRRETVLGVSALREGQLAMGLLAHEPLWRVRWCQRSGARPKHGRSVTVTPVFLASSETLGGVFAIVDTFLESSVWRCRSWLVSLGVLGDFDPLCFRP